MALASGALAAFAVWILVSASWSDAPARAVSEFDRALLYGLVLTLTGSVANRLGDLGMLLRLTAAAFTVIALAGLITRLAPATFPVAGGYLPERVAFPLTYWNAMGIACALGVVLLLHLTASGKEPGWVRVLAAAFLTPVAVTLYFTFSRGAIWALPVGLVLYLVLAQPRGLATALPAAGIPALIAVKVAYGADILAEINYTSAAAAPQARHVGIVLVVCALVAAALRAAALGLDRRIERVPLPRHARLGFAGAVIALLLVGGLAVGAPHRISHAVDTFRQGEYLKSSDLRSRLTSAVDNGRVDNWRVALDGYRESPLHGTGAGTYALTWQKYRPAPPVQINDGHSLYLETLSEMGIPGLALILLVLGTLLIGGLRRLSGPERHAYGAFVAAGTMLALHAGVDWDWEMPALFVWLFAAGGVALAAREGSRALGEMGRTPRVVAGLAVLVLGITPWLMATLAARPQPGPQQLRAGDCDSAITYALAPRIASVRGPSRGRSSATATAARASTRSPGGRWTPHTRATRTTGPTPTGRRSSTACPGSTRGPTRRRRCG